MFENKTPDNITKDMLENVSDDLDKREGAIIHTAIAPAAVEIGNAYMSLSWLYQEMFPDTASRENLIRHAEERGLSPYPATKAILKGVFNIDIELGTRFSAVSSDLTYITVKQIAFGEYEVECEQPGSQGNSYLGNIVPIEYVAGLTSAELTEKLIFGEDEEDTEDFRQRYYDSFNAQAFGGNRADYIAKSNSIGGVGGTKVYRATPSAGYVKLVIIGSDFTVPTLGTVGDVQEAIDPTQDNEGLGLAPIDHIVTVYQCSETPIDVTMEIVYQAGFDWEDVQPNVIIAVNEYLLNLAKSWESTGVNGLVVSTTHMAMAVVSVPGILDAYNTTINGNTESLVLASENIPLLSSFSPTVRVGGS